MNFADYVFNMTKEDFDEAKALTAIIKDLPKNHELRLRIEELRDSLLDPKIEVDNPSRTSDETQEESE